MRELKPIAVLGVGGFASGPILFASSLLGYRSLIWEPNAYPGLANRILAPRVKECLLVFEEAGKHLRAQKLTQSGLPVRAEMKPNQRTNSSNLRVLVFGGSQGARFINNLVAESLSDGAVSGIEVVHQTGSADFARIKSMYGENARQNGIEVYEYLHDMDKRYAWADVVVCRAGASTVAEICACEKAAIFIPLPTAADDHQRKNAEVLTSVGAALMMQQKDLTPAVFRETIIKFRDNRELASQFENNVRRFRFPNAAEKIVERVLDF